MNTTLFSRPLVQALRLCLGVILLAGLALVPSPPPALAAISFTDLGACGLPGLRWAELAWGDYDNDGDLDLLVHGDTVSGYVTRIYRHDGGTTFVDIGAGLTSACNSVAWGDYDGDGDLDALCGGYLYRNDGGTFVPVASGLPGTGMDHVAWGDYDNDGDLDVLSGSGLYRNDGGTFVHVDTALPGVSLGDVAWGDYDNDGDQDVLVSGDAGGTFIARIYRNDTSGAFAQVYAAPQGLWQGSVAWGDYDNDGDLDVLLTGEYYDGSDYVAATKIYRNDTGGTFTDIDAGLPGVYVGEAAWGDYDNDGDLDVLLTGKTSGGSGRATTAIYRNNGDGTFSDSRLRLPAASDSAVAWGDYDNDGDLDFVVAGDDAGARVIHLCRNDTTTANSAPGTPGSPAASLDGATAHLSWSAASDSKTPAAGLTYNLRLGTAPGAGDVAPPMANASTGWRRVPQLGNANHGLTATLTLPVGTYYWSVQAVDNAFAGGAFATEGSFEIVPAPPGQATIAGPTAGEVSTSYGFTATVTPSTAELPLTYEWEATGQGPVSHEVSSLSDAVSYSWRTAGTKAITVTVSNALGQAQGTHSIVIQTPPPFTDLGGLGLPAAQRTPVAWGDYDNDGDLDLLYGGDTGTSLIARVYRNDGGAFTDLGAGLPGIKDGTLAWGDYDNDGDLDIFLAGNTSRTSLVMTAGIYRNDGGVFTNINAGVPGTNLCGAAWGDYDNDRDLDLLYTGATNVVGDLGLIRLYRNDGGTFTSVGTALPWVSYCAVAWGDYDNDGDLDLFLAGVTGSPFAVIARIYRSDGGGVFTNINAGLTGVLWAAAAWGDYDVDGDLDVALTGKLDPSQATRIARIYRNDTGGVFTDINAGLAATCAGSVAWGDQDNDGDLDLLLVGSTTAGAVSKVYRNTGGAFTDIGAGLQGVSYAGAAWADYDEDGDLDFILAGYTGSDNTVHVYRSNAAPVNSPPTAPSDLTSGAQGSVLTLHWGAAADAETPANGLSYNLRVGRAPGGQEVATPMADVGTGWRRVPRLGYARPSGTARLTLPPGTYYWSVQAVDGALAGGAFAAEASAVVPQPPLQVAVSGATEGALNVAYTFTATVTPVSTTLPLTYTWSATAQGPVTHGGVEGLSDTAAFTWSTAGPKTVTVTVANAGGSATGSWVITLYDPPSADLVGTPTSGPAPLVVMFTNASGGNYTTSEWDFGDHTGDTATNPTHTYAQPGPYTVTLTVTGPGGTDAEVKPAYITVYTPVQADFTGVPTAGIAPLAVTFTDLSTGDYTDLLWDFGDGITSTLAGSVHEYAAGGLYTVTLTVTGPGGQDTEAKPGYVTVYTPPQAAFDGAPRGGVAPLTVSFSDESTGDYDQVVWDFGDGITSTLPGPTHTYELPGPYTVTLSVSGLGGGDVEVQPGYVSVFAGIPDPGPQRSDLALQNLGAAPAPVNLAYTAGEAGALTHRYDLGERLGVHASRVITSGELEPAVAGDWSGSALVLSTQPLAVLVEDAWDYALGAHTAAAYAGREASTVAYLPALACGDGYLTLVSVQNPDGPTAHVTLRFYDRNGALKRVHSAPVPGHEQRTFSVAELGPDFSSTGGWGTGTVVADHPVVVAATVHWTAASEAYSAPALGGTVLWAPGLYRRHNVDESWERSQLSVQDLGDTDTGVQVEFVNPDGSVAYTLHDSIPNKGAACYDTAAPGTLDPATWQALASALGDSWQGSVRVTSTGGEPLAGVTVRWAPGAGVSDNLGYAASGPWIADQDLAFPDLWREVGGASDTWSEVWLQNTAATAGMFTLQFHASDGTAVGDAWTIAVPALGSLHLDLKEGGDLPAGALTALGSDFRGSLVVTPGEGLAVVGAAGTFQPGEGRAAGYAGFAVP